MKARILEGIHRGSIEERFVPRVQFEWDCCLPTPTPVNRISLVTPSPWPEPRSRGYANSEWPLKNNGLPIATCIPRTPTDLRRANGKWFAARSHGPNSSPKPHPCHVFIKTTTGRTVSLTARTISTTIRTLKNMILTKEGIPPTAYYLTSNGKLLQDNAALSDITSKPPYFIAMNIPLVGGAPTHLATKPNPKICLRTNQRAPSSPHWHPPHPVLTRRSEGMSKYHHTAGYALKGRRPTWP